MQPDETGLPDEGELTQAQTTAPERPDWLPENFDSPEALAESYKHAQRKISEQGQRLSERERELEAERERREAIEASLTAEQPRQYTPGQDPLIAAYEHAYQEGDATMMLAIQADLATRAAQQVLQQQPKPQEPADTTDYDALGYQAEQAVWGQHGEEYGALREKVADKLTEHPELIADKTFNGLQRGIDLAFQLARGEKLAAEQRKAAQQEAEAETARREKRQAQTATGSGSRPAPPDEAKAIWERIKAAPDGGLHIPTA